MSTKEALSDFQSRLAKRLSISDREQATAESAYWLAVVAGADRCLLPLSQSGEIFPWVEPQSIPYTTDWFLGVANLRGALCGVVSLSKYLGTYLPHGQHEDMKLNTQERRLIGFHPSLDVHTVLVIDRLLGLKNRGQMVKVDGEIYRDEANLTWREIDLKHLSRNPTFISIAQ